MKQPLALRIDAGLLREARRCACEENRTLTNFIETLLKAHIARGRNVPADPSLHKTDVVTAPDTGPLSKRKAGESRRRRCE